MLAAITSSYRSWEPMFSLCLLHRPGSLGHPGLPPWLRLGILVTVVAAILAGLLIDIMTTVVLLLVLGLVGISIGGALRETLAPQKVFALGVAASLIAYVLLLFFSQALFQVNVVDLLMDSFRQSIDQVTALYSKMGMSEEQLGEARSMMENMMNLAGWSSP